MKQFVMEINRYLIIRTTMMSRQREWKIKASMKHIPISSSEKYVFNVKIDEDSKSTIVRRTLLQNT